MWMSISVLGGVHSISYFIDNWQCFSKNKPLFPHFYILFLHPCVEENQNISSLVNGMASYSHSFSQQWRLNGEIENLRGKKNRFCAFQVLGSWRSILLKGICSCRFQRICLSDIAKVRRKLDSRRIFQQVGKFCCHILKGVFQRGKNNFILPVSSPLYWRVFLRFEGKLKIYYF